MIDLKDIPQDLKPRWVTRKKWIEKTTSDEARNPMTNVLGYNAYATRDALGERTKYIEKNEYQYVALHEECVALISAFSGRDNWKDELAFALHYYLFYDRLDYFWHTQTGHFHDGQGLRLQDFEKMSNSMAYCFMLGWTEQAVYQGYLTFAAMNQGFQLVAYGTEHKHAHTFMLRLFADWRGDVSHPFLEWSYEVPLYEGLLQRWRDPDPETIKPWLQRACEHHAYEAKQDTSRNFYDFGNFRVMRTPLEIHMILRLRELEGLANPSVEHELMDTPFNALLPPQPVLPPNEIMQGTLKRVRKEWPNFEGVTALATIKAVPPKPWKFTTAEAYRQLGLKIPKKQ